MKGPIEFREAGDLFYGIITEYRSGVDAILGEACHYQDHEGLGREINYIIV